jgi:hypothetical protein
MREWNTRRSTRGFPLPKSSNDGYRLRIQRVVQIAALENRPLLTFIREVGCKGKAVRACRRWKYRPNVYPSE